AGTVRRLPPGVYFYLPDCAVHGPGVVPGALMHFLPSPPRGEGSKKQNPGNLTRGRWGWPHLRRNPLGVSVPMKIVKLTCLVCFLFLAIATPVLAQGPPTTTFKETTSTVRGVPQTSVFSGAALGAGLGMAITIIGAGIGLGRIGSAAMEGMARQPEVAPRIQTAMIIIAAMLEGATLASVILCFLIGGSATF